MKNLKKITILFLSWRIFLFIIAYLAPLFLQLDSNFSYLSVLIEIFPIVKKVYLWANFDGIHYLTIADRGYKGTALIQAFFPVYPMLIRFISSFQMHFISAGLIVSNLSFFGLMLVWYRLIRQKFDHKISWLSLLVLLTFPTSFFFGALYSESLFLLLIVSTFYFASRRNWLLAGLMAAIASGTRVVGIFLVPALLLEYLICHSERSEKIERNRTNLASMLTQVLRQALPTGRQAQDDKATFVKHLFYISFGSLGLLSYMYYLYITFNDPFYFYHVQSEFGGGRQESIVFYPQVVWRYLKILFIVPWGLQYYVYFQEFVVSTVGLALLLLPLIFKIVNTCHHEILPAQAGLPAQASLLGSNLSKRFRSKFEFIEIPVSWLLFSLGAFLLPTLTGTFSSMPRYLLVCFPIFIVIAIFLEKFKKLQIIYFTLSTLLLIVNTILFIQGYWVG